MGHVHVQVDGGAWAYKLVRVCGRSGQGQLAAAAAAAVAAAGCPLISQAPPPVVLHA